MEDIHNNINFIKKDIRDRFSEYCIAEVGTALVSLLIELHVIHDVDESDFERLCHMQMAAYKNVRSQFKKENL